ncbi:MAG: response regulator, partial [Actinobacteria bacterium]|nr:response regulator [Actinomycetota bacterium]
MSTGSSTILVVDDDEEIRDVLRMIFELDGFTVWEAANGLDAVTTIMKTHPEFVILDYQMPVQDGEKTATVLRSVAPETTIVALSGVITSKPHWADAYLSKEKLAQISPLIGSLASSPGAAATA